MERISDVLELQKVFYEFRALCVDLRNKLPLNGFPHIMLIDIYLPCSSNQKKKSQKFHFESTSHRVQSKSANESTQFDDRLITPKPKFPVNLIGHLR